MRLKRGLRVTFLALSFATSVLAQETKQESLSQPARNLSVPSTQAGDEDSQYRIGPGDLLKIEVFNRAQLSREERVDQRGMIRLPLIEADIPAACQTEKGLADDIAKKYREMQLLNNPSVSVAVKDFQSQPVAVLGAVKDPGRFLLQRRVRLLELVFLIAGGPTANAGRKAHLLSTQPTAGCTALNQRPRLVQNSNPPANTATFDLLELSQGKSDNPYVRQGDVITILPAEEAIVVGNVLRPAAISLVEPVTLSRAIAMVGGVLPNSRKEKIRITRRVAGSTSTTELVVDLKDQDKSKGADFPLQGGDIVEVSTKTGLQAILAGLAKTIIPTAASFPVRLVP